MGLRAPKSTHLIRKPYNVRLVNDKIWNFEIFGALSLLKIEYKKNRGGI